MKRSTRNPVLTVSALLVAGAVVLAPRAAFSQATNTSCDQAADVPAANIPYSQTFVTTTAPAVSPASEPAFVCKGSKVDFPTGRTVYFTFTPAVTDNYQIDTFGSVPSDTYDSILGIFTGLCGSLQPLPGGCNDDAAGSVQSSVQIGLTAGTKYTFVVSCFGGRDQFGQLIAPAGGTLKLNVKRVAITYPYNYIVPSVANVQGRTLYVSDVNITNQEAAAGTFQIDFLGNGIFGNPNPPTNQASIDPAPISPNGSREYVDILGATFGKTGTYGALKIRSTRRLAIGARTYTAGPTGGSFGQYAPAVDLSSGDVLLSGQSGQFIGVREDVDTRTNIAIFNASGVPCAAQLEVRNNLGDIVLSGSKGSVVPPNTMVQVSGLKSFFGFNADVRNASIVLRNFTDNCTLGGVAYIIDNTTQDPFAVPLKKQ